MSKRMSPGLNFGGEKAQKIKDTMRAIKKNPKLAAKLFGKSK